MAATNDTVMPSDIELTVPQEITLSTPWFKAVAPFMARQCEDEIKQFMILRIETEDPRKTLKEGAAVTACGIDFLRKLKKTCSEEATAYANCIDEASFKLYINKCREPQRYLDKCVEEKLDIQRPKLGYFSKLHVHDPKVPKPGPKIRDYKEEAKNLMDELPANYIMRNDYKRYEDFKTSIIEK